MGLRSILVALAFAALAGQARAEGCTLERLAELPVTMSGLRPLIPAKVNGHDALFMADSGAFFSIMSPAAAKKFGLKIEPSPFGFYVLGASGKANASVVTSPTFELGGIPFRKVDFLIIDHAVGGDEAAGVIGQNLLRSADIEYDLANGLIRLFHTKNCEHADLAYWALHSSFSVISIDRTEPSWPHIQGVAYVNGVRLNVMFDTGASTSVLTLRGAARAGLKKTDEGVKEGGLTRGIGDRAPTESWIAPVASFKLGEEEVKNTRLRVADVELSNADMMIGADFFLSHRVYISPGRRELYFSYNGGSVFDLTTKPSVDPAPAAAPSDTSAPDAFSNAPTDADGFSRRAAAAKARHDYPAAIADLTKAIALDPKEAKYPYQRAMAEWSNKQSDLAVADLDLAIKLDPKDVVALINRANLRSVAKDKVGAKQDLDKDAQLLEPDAKEHLVLGGLYERDGFYVEAVEQYSQWIATHDKTDGLAEGLNARCWARAEWGHDLDKALDDCNAALKLSPGVPAYLDSRGLVHLRMNDLALSIADYQAALRDRPKEAWSLYGKGLAEAKKGLKAESEADLKAAVAADPEIADKAKAVGVEP